MSTVADITVSVDGFVTGPDPGPDRGLGVGGEALHRWALDSDDPSTPTSCASRPRPPARW